MTDFDRAKSNAVGLREGGLCSVGNGGREIKRDEVGKSKSGVSTIDVILLVQYCW